MVTPTRSLPLVRPVPYIVPDEPVQLIQVGCGGTGSHLAARLAQLAVQLRSLRRPAPPLVLIDGDAVEERNVGRQQFQPADIGRNKAETTAFRLNAAFGLTFEAIPCMATGRLLGALVARRPVTLLLGAVDAAAGRRALATCLEQASGASARTVVWIDAGNHAASGQVLVGTTTDLRTLERAVILDGQLCGALPAPSVIEPDLIIDPPPQPAVRDCAAAVAADLQALYVNVWMAGIMAQYVEDLIVRRRITRFRTEVDLTTRSMQSTPITPAAIAAVVAAARERAAREQTARRRTRRATKGG